MLSHLSSRIRSWSPGAARSRSSFWSPSRRGDPLEDWQEEHSSADIVEVVSWIRDICSLPPARLNGGRCVIFVLAKIQKTSPPLTIAFPQVIRPQTFRRILTTAALHHCPSGMRSKKVSKLLQYLE